MTEAVTLDTAVHWCRETLVMDSICVVVGLGSGVHVAELIKQNKMDKVYVVDHRSHLVTAFRSQFPELQEKVELIIVKDEASLMGHKLMDQVIEHNLSSLAFSAC